MEQFRHMTFNIRGAHFNDGENVWTKRADLNVQTIQKYDPDIIGFQELHMGNLVTYIEHLSGYERLLGPESSVMYEFQHNSIFWKRDRFDMLEFGSFFLSETPDRWSMSWETACVRSATWTHLRSIQTGQELFYVNAHLDHISEHARQEGSKLIVRRLLELRGAAPAIVTADFNAVAWVADEQREGDVHHIYTSAGFKDTYLEAGNAADDGTSTFHGFEGAAFESKWSSARIDWVLTLDGTHKLETLACEIVRDEQPPLYPSDHYPVVADLRLV